MEKKYVPLNPVVDDFTGELSHGIRNASQYGKFMDTLGHGKELKITISDALMDPALRKGDIVTIKPTSIDKMNVGDLLFYRLGPTMVVRRVIKSVIQIGDTYLVTKADTSNVPEKSVKASQVIGKVIKVERNGKNIRVPNQASFFDKLTAFGTIPFHVALFRKILSFIPFVRPKDDY